jgi:AraC family transcriptional regulator of adaptative response / DNA-3-methyladenine glycosylase II
MELDFDSCVRAFESRDRRFDGRFFTGVRTTGIYCRPSCPAPRPKRSNLRFFACAAAAEEAGFRACLRCRPEAAPGSALWRGTSVTVGRALRLIEDGALDRGSVEQLASRLGVSSRWLRRLFVEQLGATPHGVAHTRRIHFARRLLDETALPITDVAHVSGFASVRRFNHAFRDAFRRAPRELRRERRDEATAPRPARNGASARGAGGRGASGRRTPRPGAVRRAPAIVPPGPRAAFELRLPARPPFDAAPLFAFLATRAIPGVEQAGPDFYRRSFAIGEARGIVDVRAIGREPALAVRVEGDVNGALHAIVTRVGRVFDVQTDPAPILATLRRDAALNARLLRRRDVRVPGAFDPFELAVRAILGQQISVRAASTLAGRIVAACGEPLGAASSDSITHTFPQARSIARADLSKLGIVGARQRSLRALAEAVASGALDFDALGGLEDATARLAMLPGIGEWTAQYIALRALGEPDAFPIGDLGVQHALGLGASARERRLGFERANAWRPWRAYAVLALWMFPAVKRPRTKESK